jgi:hypothetical protein
MIAILRTIGESDFTTAGDQLEPDAARQTEHIRRTGRRVLVDRRPSASLGRAPASPPTNL